ncbi:MAG: tetratricopeptide repeat protein [Burkholderiaceae bacterium]|nr:tetratricopeptide repeat protein [Burkholderiaceae bacterium]
MKQGLLSPRALLGLALAGLLSLAHANDQGEIGQLLREGRLAEAQTRVDRLLAAKPRDPQLRLYKGVIQRETGRTNEALATFTKLSEDHPELPEPYNNLAVIHAAQGQYDKARVALEKALRTHPSYATAHDNLADVYARLASQAYSKALQLDGAAPSPAQLALIRDLGPVNGSARPATVVAAAPATPAAPAPSVAKPAPPPPAAVSAPVKPAAPVPAASSPAAPADGAREVEQAVRAWAQAWSDRDMNRYLAAYDARFETPGRQDRSAWEQDRRARIVGKSRITVQLLDLQVTVQGQRAVAKFRQDYKADTLAVLSRKTLELTRTGNRWLIVKESSGG